MFSKQLRPRRIRLFISLFLVLLFPFACWSQGPSLWGDFKQSCKYFADGSVEQFQTKSNLYYLLGGIGATWYAFEHDERVTNLMMSREIDGVTKAVEDIGPIMAFPLVSYSFWQVGKWKQDEHLRQFAMEYMASMYIALVESALLSHVNIHSRPKQDSLSFWETKFRGKSSWPSGHIIPLSTLTFKTLQFYGPYWSLLPMGLTYLVARQRVMSGKHWFSDVVASIFISAMASEGVRQAAGYQKNHPFYKRVFEQQINLAVIRHQGSWGLKLSFFY